MAIHAMLDANVKGDETLLDVTRFIEDVLLLQLINDDLYNALQRYQKRVD